MRSRPILVAALALTTVALGGCWLPEEPPPEPEVVQETEPNNTTLQANELPLAPDSFSGTIATAEDAGGADYWTYTATEAGELAVELIACGDFTVLTLFTAADPFGDGSQCGSLSLELATGEQAFLSIEAGLPSSAYTLRATFTPAP